MRKQSYRRHNRSRSCRRRQNRSRMWSPRRIRRLPFRIPSRRTKSSSRDKKLCITRIRLERRDYLRRASIQMHFAAPHFGRFSNRPVGKSLSRLLLGGKADIGSTL